MDTVPWISHPNLLWSATTDPERRSNFPDTISHKWSPPIKTPSYCVSIPLTAVSASCIPLRCSSLHNSSPSWWKSTLKVFLEQLDLHFGHFWYCIILYILYNYFTLLQVMYCGTPEPNVCSFRVSSPILGRFSAWEISWRKNLPWLATSNRQRVSCLFTGDSIQTVVVWRRTVSRLDSLGDTEVTASAGSFTFVYFSPP